MKTLLATRKAPTSLSETKPDYKCAECKDTYWITTAQGCKRCVCYVPTIIASALDPKYRDAQLSDFSRAVTDRIVQWVGAPSEGLLITGPAGVGKTHLAAGLVRALIETGKRVVFKRASELYIEIRKSYDGTGLSEEAILANYCEAAMLVLDDLGAGSISDHERRIALEVIDRRGNYMRPTVITSNRTAAEIGELMDERIGSRLGAYQVIAITGRDRRKKANG